MNLQRVNRLKNTSRRNHRHSTQLFSTRWSKLERAIRNRGSLEEITRLLDRGAPTANRSGSQNALAIAVSHGRGDIVPLLLDRGANINMVDCDHGTALIAAIDERYKDIVLLLLDRGADINVVARSKHGTALAAAASWRYQSLSMLPPDVFLVNEYGTAKAKTTSWRNDAVSLLLDRGADINAVNGEYGTALTSAVISQNMDSMLLLIDRGADVNIVVGGQYGTALTAAVLEGSMDALSLLLDRGADLNMVVGKYGTALTTAIIHGKMCSALLLLGRGADVNVVVGGKYGTTLVAAVLKRSTENIPLLLDRGADINALGGEYGSALGAAAFGQRRDVISLLLDRGADVNLVVGTLGTVLGQAIYTGSTDTALLLLEYGADIMHVGGSYSAASGMYPSALDAAHSEGSRANPALIELLTTKQNERTKHYQPTNADTDPVNDVMSRPPFPMPYHSNPALYTNQHKGTFSSSSRSSFDILSIPLCASGNITPEQADVPCQELNGEVLWRSLVALVGLHEDKTQARRHWIQKDVQYFAVCNFDFGFAYAAVRIAWKHFNEHDVDCSKISVQRGQWHKHARMLDEARSKAIEVYSSSGQVQQEVITLPYSIMPRRLWDLKSNRVIDFRILHAAQPTIETRPGFWAVTHSWTSDMSPVWTSINQHQWPVPLPKDISLEYLRSELLTLGAEYVWIDVLCLRQQSEDNYLEQLRQEEWKVDVPTIGNIYRAAKNIVRYFNGLGVCFSNKDWDSPRHWLQRAWTLQEIAAENTTINGGTSQDRGKVFLNCRGEVSGKVINLRSAIRPVIQLAAQVDSQHGCEVYELAQEMARRHASQPVDKLSGLFYLLRTTKLPCYDQEKTSEDFWGQCFHLLPAERKAEILLNFPYRGSDKQWFPTWAQVLAWPVRDPECDHARSESLPRLGTISGEMSFFIRNIWTIPDVVLIKTDNPGEYQVKTNNWHFGFYLPYLEQEPIDIQGLPVFTLAIADLGHAHNWVVCKAIDECQWVGADIDLGVAEFKILKKVGVIRTDSSSALLVGGLLQKQDCLFV